jgi:hypothetical protein
MEKFYFNGQPVTVEYLNQIIIRFVKTKSPYSQKSVQQDLVQDIWCLILQTWRKTLLLDNDILNRLIWGLLDIKRNEKRQTDKLLEYLNEQLNKNGRDFDWTNSLTVYKKGKPEPKSSKRKCKGEGEQVLPKWFIKNRRRLKNYRLSSHYPKSFLPIRDYFDQSSGFEVTPIWKLSGDFLSGDFFQLKGDCPICSGHQCLSIYNDEHLGLRFKCWGMYSYPKQDERVPKDTDTLFKIIELNNKYHDFKLCDEVEKKRRSTNTGYSGRPDEYLFNDYTQSL